MTPKGSPLTLLRMTARHLYRRPMRTSLTALGVAVGVVAIVAFTTISRGLWKAVDGIVHISESELLVFEANISADIFSALDEDETRAKLLAVPGVAGTVGTLWHVLRVEQQPFCLAVGMRLDDMAYHEPDVIRGRLPASDDEALLGSIAGRAFDKDVGDTLRISGTPYRVAGIYQTDVVFFNGGVVLSLPRLQPLAAKEGRVTAFHVALESGADPGEVADRIERAHPELVAIADASEYNKVDQGLEMVQGMVWAVSFIAIVIGSLVVANTMWMAVLERTREIGVLRAVGWSRWRIVAMIVLEATGVGLLACVVGSLLGCGLAKLVTVLPVSEMYLDPVFDAAPFLLALAVAVVLSVLGALMPAWRAAQISPAEALRYE